MIFALAGKELRLLLRDVHGLAVLFLMPTVFILIMSLAMQNAFNRDGNPVLTAQVTNNDSGSLGARVVARLRESGAIELVASQANPDFSVTLPPGFSQRLFEAPDDTEQPLFAWSSEPTALPQARAAFRAQLTGAVLRVQGDELISIMEREQGAELSRLREVMNPERWNVAHSAAHSDADSKVDSEADSKVDSEADNTALPSAVQQSVPGWLVFAMFFVVVPLSAVIIVEREQGTDLRLRALQVTAWQTLFARLPPYFLVNMLQLGAMLAVGVWLVPLFGGEALALGAHPAALLLVATATSVAAIGLAMLVATLSTTSVQAIALGGTLNLVFGALGGIMVPKMIMPAGMQAAANVSPMSWALEGFWDILLRGGTPVDAWPECLALVVFGLAALALAALLHGRRNSHT